MKSKAGRSGSPWRRRASARVIIARRQAARRRLIGIGVAGVLAAAAALLFAMQGEPKEKTRAASQGVAYVAWDGKRASTADFVGKPLVVNFWASWCVPCLAEIPRFVEVYERHKSEVAFLGLNLQDDPQRAESLRRELGITYPLGRDPEARAYKTFEGVTMPTTVLIDEDGRVVELIHGEISGEDLEAKVQKLIEEA